MDFRRGTDKFSYIQKPSSRDLIAGSRPFVLTHAESSPRKRGSSIKVKLDSRFRGNDSLVIQLDTAIKSRYDVGSIACDEGEFIQ